MDPSLSVLITTYRRPAGLRRLLAAVAPHVRGRPEREIVVVNDGTHDADYQAVLDDYSDVVRYEPLKENVGVGAARNRAASLARKDYLVYTDDDCEPPSWWLDWLSALLTRYPEIDVVAGTTRPLWTKKRSFLERVQAHYEFIPHPWKTGDLFVFVTANVAIRRSLFEAVGGFRVHERFLRAGEDTELTVRLAKAGARQRVDLDWYVRHEVGGRLRDQLRRYEGYGYANVWITRLTTAPPLHAVFAKARWQEMPKHGRWVWRTMSRKSAGFSPSPAVRLLSVAMAAAIQLSHFVGCIHAAEDRRRELQRMPAP